MIAHLDSRYLDYDADVIYNDLKDLFSTSSIQKDAFFVRDWGMATFVEGGSVDAKDRLLHVGIDYTQYVTEDGTTLKNKEYGVHEKETFDGYEYVTTRTETNGDTVHVYKKVVTPTNTPEPEQPATLTDPTPTQPETPVNHTPQPETPGDNSGNINGGNDEDTTPANPTEGETPVSPTPTPNPTPKPDVPVVEDNHGNNTGGNTETPVVPTPTPEPNVPTEETPVQPVEPTKPNEEKPVVPNNPTDSTVVPPTVEEKPLDNTVSNKVEENTVVNNTNSSTTSSKKDDRVIETGVRTNVFTNLAMTVISGLGLLGLVFKKKETK